MADAPKNALIERFVSLARLTFQDPRHAAMVVRDDVELRFIAMPVAVIVISLGTILSILSLWLTGGTPAGALGQLIGAPLAFAIVQLLMLLVVAIAIVRIGRLFGGQGQFWPTLTLMVWLQTLMLAAQVVIFVVGLLAAGLSALLSLAVSIYFLWLTLIFIAASHKFQSLLLVFLISVGSIFVFSFVAAIVLATLGFEPEVRL